MQIIVFCKNGLAIISKFRVKFKAINAWSLVVFYYVASFIRTNIERGSMKKILIGFSAVGVVLISTFFYTEYQAQQIKNETATIKKLAYKKQVVLSDQALVKIIQNTNRLASYADQKALIERLFEAGYRADKNEIKNIAEPQVEKLVIQILGSNQSKDWHVASNQLVFTRQNGLIYFIGDLTMNNGDKSITYTLSGTMNSAGNMVNELTFGHLVKGE